MYRGSVVGLAICLDKFNVKHEALQLIIMCG